MRAVTDVAPVTVRPLDTVALPATDASDCAVTIPDAVRAATDVTPETVRPLDTVALPATDASDCAVNAPDAVRVATDVAPVTVSPCWAVTKPFATVVPVTLKFFATVAFPPTDASDCAANAPDAVSVDTDVAPLTLSAPVTDASPPTNKRLFMERSPCVIFTGPANKEVPETSNVERGLVLPIPTFPL